MSGLKKRSSEKSYEKPTSPIPVALFESLFVYMLSDFRKKTFINKMSTFFNTVNTNIYREDEDVMDLYKFIQLIIDMILETDINETSHIVDKLLDSPKNGDEFDELYNVEYRELIETFDPTTAMFVENEMIDRLNFIKVTAHVERMRKVIARYDTCDYDSYNEIISDIKSASSSITKTITARASSMLTIPDLDLGSNEFLPQLETVRSRMMDKKLVIKTGIKRLNRVLGGGFQPGRVYFFLGLTGGLILGHVKLL